MTRRHTLAARNAQLSSMLAASGHESRKVRAARLHEMQAELLKADATIVALRAEIDALKKANTPA